MFKTLPVEWELLATVSHQQVNVIPHPLLFLPASRKTAEKSRGQRRRKPSSEPVAQNDEDTHMLLMAIPGPGIQSEISV